jgi:hypothetical protein
MTCLVIAGGLAAWRFWPHLAPASSKRTNPPAAEADTNARTNAGTDLAPTKSPSAATETKGVESPRTENAPAGSSGTSASPGVTSVDDNPATETASRARESQRSAQASEVVRNTPAAKREQKAVSRGAGFAEALLRARDDENQGKFEDALREYEHASTLDPSDAALKHHIKHLREQVQKENELIH